MVLQVEEGNFEGFDGSELFFQTWTKSQPSAIILGIHGLGEHSGSYQHLAEGLASSSYQLTVSDLRGHGKSSGKRGVGTIDEYVRDLRLFQSLVKDRYQGLPLFFLGHSMGGLILLKMLIRHGSMGARGVVVSSPLLGVTVEIPAYKKKSAGILASLAPNLTLHNEIPNAHLTHDKKIVAQYEGDPWRHNRVSPRLYVNLLKDMQYVFECRDKLQGPLLMQLSGEDYVVSQKASLDLFAKLNIPNKKLIVYEGYYHEVYNEVGRQRVFDDLLKWLDEQMAMNQVRKDVL